MNTAPNIVAQYPSHEDFSPRIAEVMHALSEELGFVAQEEVQRRMIYDANKVWRVKIRGAWNGQPADLKIDSIAIGVQEMEIRERFSRVQTAYFRPPKVFAYEAYSEERGYGFMLEEVAEGPILFDANDAPEVAASAFVSFYTPLEEVLKQPFVDVPQNLSTKDFVQEQYASWVNVAKGVVWEGSEERFLMADEIFARAQDFLSNKDLVFMHAHLAGSDVQREDEQRYIVHANHFWGWRPSMYDLAFPVWQQWMALPSSKRGCGEVERITRVWGERLRAGLGERFDEHAWKGQLLNRVYGSILLDIPAIARREGVSFADMKEFIEELMLFSRSEFF